MAVGGGASLVGSPACPSEGPTLHGQPLLLHATRPLIRRPRRGGPHLEDLRELDLLVVEDGVDAVDGLLGLVRGASLRFLVQDGDQGPAGGGGWGVSEAHSFSLPTLTAAPQIFELPDR